MFSWLFTVLALKWQCRWIIDEPREMRCCSLVIQKAHAPNCSGHLQQAYM